MKKSQSKLLQTLGGNEVMYKTPRQPAVIVDIQPIKKGGGTIDRFKSLDQFIK